MGPEITVAIPTYNREAVLIDTIRDVLSQGHRNLELLVLDQTKTHRPETRASLDLIRDDRLRYFRISPPSVSAARNFALRRARAAFVVFVDDDVRMSPELVGVHLQAIRGRPELGAVAGRVLQDGFPIGRDVLRFDRFAMTHGMFTATEPGFTNAFPGGNFCVRVADALSLGGFDTRYRGNSFREENDLSVRMAEAGRLIYFEPRAVLTHLAASEGGCRGRTPLYEDSGFYGNELFFTLRLARGRDRLEALQRKYRAYCFPGRNLAAWRRRGIFFRGLAAAAWRVCFGRQISAREVAPREEVR
ncbi:MAG: glycosyltransferase family 2 protein [Thermoanaerobaculia bacterium]